MRAPRVWHRALCLRGRGQRPPHHSQCPRPCASPYPAPPGPARQLSVLEQGEGSGRAKCRGLHGHATDGGVLFLHQAKGGHQVKAWTRQTGTRGEGGSGRWQRERKPGVRVSGREQEERRADTQGQELRPEMGTHRDWTHRDGERVKIKRDSGRLRRSGGWQLGAQSLPGTPRPLRPHRTPRWPFPSVLTWNRPTPSAAHSPQPSVTLSLTLCPAESWVSSGWSHHLPSLGRLNTCDFSNVDGTK